jgi:hypothetical protein
MKIQATPVHPINHDTSFALKDRILFFSLMPFISFIGSLYGIVFSIKALITPVTHWKACISNMEKLELKMKILCGCE